MYQYAAQVKRVIDGDSVVMILDIGFDLTIQITTRLWHKDGMFDTPEVRGASKVQGLESKQFVLDWVKANGPDFVVHTHQDKRGKFGRYLADIVTLQNEKLTECLLSHNLAKVIPW